MNNPSITTTYNEETIEIGYKIVTGQTNTFGYPKYDNLFFASLNDVQSSTLREAITAYGCKYKWLSGKHGFDAVDESTGENKEIKPKLYTTKKSDGGGNFSDLTTARVESYKANDFGMINSYFVNNRLAYILEFKFSDILTKIETHVIDECTVKQNRYARSSNYNYVNYVNSPNLKFHHIDWELITSTSCLNRNFYKALKISYDKQFPE